MELRRLHVWEHPDLHRADPNPPLGSEPVHVIYESHEFDWWMIDQLGDLHIGYLESQPLHPKQQPGELTQIHVTQTHMARGMFAKVYEETFAYEPVAEPAAIQPASVPIATVEPVASGTMTGDDTTLLPIVSRGEEYEVERSSPFPPLEPDDPHREPDEPDEPEPDEPEPDEPEPEPEAADPVQPDGVEALPPLMYLSSTDIPPLDVSRLDFAVPKLGLMASGSWPSASPPRPRSRVPKGKKRRRRAVVR